MVVHHWHTTEETTQLLINIGEEVKQLRAAVQVYAAIAEHFLRTAQTCSIAAPASQPGTRAPIRKAS